MLGGRQMARLAGATRERSVGDRPQQGLEEYVLAALRRALVVIASEDLFGDQAVEDHRDLGLRPLAECGRGSRR